MKERQGRKTMGTILNVLFDERLGGPQLRAIQVARRLRPYGVKTRIAIPQGGAVLTKRLDAEQIDYDELNLVRPRQTFDPLPHINYAWNFWPNVLRLRKLIRRHSIKVVHTNGLMHLQAATAARLEKVGLVWHINDFVTPGPVTPVFVRLVRSWANRVAVASRAVGDFYFPGDDLDGRLEVVYPPVNTDLFHPGVDGSAIRKEFALPQNCIIIGTVGNLTPLKGADILIKALPAVIEQFPQLKAFVIGARLENRRAYFESLIRLSRELGVSDHLVFTDQRNDIPQFMAAMTVYVHPARTEACGMAVLEASASGVPVVASRVGGVPETLLANETGVMVTPDQPQEFSQAVIALLKSSETCERMGKAGVEFCSAKFSLKRCVQSHLNLYRPLLADPVGEVRSELFEEAGRGV